MGAILCEHCVAYCCRYIALPIETPADKSDFDDIRWYLLHEGVSVFVEDGDWYICVQTACRHLQPDFRCGIYETRPQICRDYSTDNCDYHSGDYGWERHFSSPEHLDEYVASEFRPPRRRRAKTAGRGRKAGRPRLKARLSPMREHSRAPQPLDYAAARHDARGVPLPILGNRA